ncbi:MAG: hypothetical protein AB1750_17580 [Chloroflexota bacterium]
MDILLEIHSALRWAIVIVAVLLIVKYAIGWAGNRPFTGMDRGLAAGFSGLMDAQALLGFVYFLWSGFAGDGFPGYRWLHMVAMILAAALGHVPSRLKALGDERRFSYSLVAVLGSMLLVYLGISALPGG